MSSNIPKGAPADLFITEALQTRPAPDADYRRENMALQSLAARLGGDTGLVLEVLVDLALDLTGAVSGGISVFEPGPGEGVFRWRALRGELAAFEGSTVPRDFSPCGIAVEGAQALLLSHPERVYTWLGEARLPEVLVAPLAIEGAQPLGTLWLVADRANHFHREHARILLELSAFVAAAARAHVREDHLRRELAHQELLAKEMSHRVRNVFAVTDGLIRMSAKSATDKDELARSISGRLHALSSAHALVSRNLHEEGRRARGHLLGLIHAVLAPHEMFGMPDRRSRFHLEGDTVFLGDQAITAMAMIVHELATNSAKYGALSVPSGIVWVQWRREDRDLHLSWTEAEGPPVAAPVTSGGFGSALVASTVTGQFAGAVDYDWREDGLRVEFRLSLERLAE